MLHHLLRPVLFLPLTLLLALTACDSVEERVANHYERGQTLLEQDDVDRAVLEFLNALKLDNKHALSHMAIGTIEESRGNLQAAFGRFRQVIDLQPDHMEARLKVIRFLVVGQALEQAETEMQVALKQDPNRADVQSLRASLAMKQGDLETARAALDLAMTLDPDNVEVAMAEVGYLVVSNQLPAARTRADEVLAQYPENLALHLLKIQILEAQSDQAGIGAQLTKIIETFPDDIRYREARARWAVRAGDVAIAEEDLRALVDAKPDDMAQVATLIRFLRQKGGDKAARAELAALAERKDDTLNYELMLAAFDVEIGHMDEAIAYLRELSARPSAQKNQARIALAKLLIAEGLVEEGQQLAVEVLAEDPNNVDATVIEITRQINADELEPAIDRIRTALNEAPNDVRLLQLAGRVQEMSGNLDLANDRYASAVRSDNYTPETVERYVGFLNRSGRFSAVDTILSEAMSRSPGNERLLDMLGFARVRLGNWSGVEQIARALAKVNPGRAQQLRAASLIAQEQFDEGANLLRSTLDTSANRDQSITALVQVYLQNGQTAEAAVFLDELLAEDAGNIQALGLRGNLYLSNGDYAAAEEKYRAILALDPDNGSAFSALARILERQGDEDGAEAQILAGLEVSPDNLLLLSRLADRRNRQAEFDESIALYERLYSLIPNSLVIANNLASALSDHRASDPEQLERAYAIAGRLRNSENPLYRDTYGWTRYLKAEYREALESIGSAAEALPKNPWIQYHLGMIHVALKQPSEARTALQAALENSNPERFPPTAVIQETLQQLGPQQ